MKRIIAIIVAIALLGGVIACSPFGDIVWFESMVVYGAEASNTTEVEGNIMAVFYRKADEQVYKWFTNVQIIDRGDGKWDVIGSQISVKGIYQETVAYGLYQYKPIPDPRTNIIYLDDLDLQAITWEDLKRSMHAAGLLDVYSEDGKPRATVRRFYMGKSYDIPDCRVSQTAYDNFNDGKIKKYDPAFGWLAPENKDCFVMVYFLSETPFNNELMIPVIVDKVIK